MSFLDFFKPKDCSQVTAQYDLRIKDLTNSLSNLTAQNTELKNNYLNSANMVKTLTIEKDNLNEIIKQLKKPSTAPFVIPVDIIDTTKFPYMPSYTSYFLNSITGKLESKVNQMTPSKYYREYTDEMYQFVMSGIKGITDPDKVKIKLRELAHNRVEYKSDILVRPDGKVVLGENWKPAHITWDDRAGDCEDSTILFVCFCGIANIPADEVFNATGYYLNGTKQTGHSFGVVKFKDGNWYVMETTAIRTPMKFKGNPQYIIKADIMNGLSNWAISGKSKQDQF